MKTSRVLLILCSLLGSLGFPAHGADRALVEKANQTLQRASVFFHDKVARHGGYVYFYSPDLERRLGEGVATADQIWVQPPATPTVGMAFLRAHEATRAPYYLDAARDAAAALAYGQLESGGWTNSIDFDPGGRVAQYRNGKGRGKNHSSLDDGQTQSAIRLMIQVDQALNFEDPAIHESAEVALAALLAAQFDNGGFPQVWTGPVESQPVVKANYPDYDWRSEGRIKEYWDYYTLNDNVCGYVADTLADAYRIYKDDKYLDALKRLGDFLLLAQMPDPQPGWAQQYNYQMQPIWARKFEPPAMSGDETQETLETLMDIFRVTGDRKYLEPIPRALAWLQDSLLDDGRIARYYELQSNKPLYMERSGDVYRLSYDDSNLPSHYGWKTDSRLNEIESRYRGLAVGATPLRSGGAREFAELERRVRDIVAGLDAEGRWINEYQGELMVGQAKFRPGDPYLSSEVFSKNVETLSEYLALNPVR